MTSTLRFELRELLGRFPWAFYRTYGRRASNRHLRISPATQLVIEGYPRSANTFAVVAFQRANPEVAVAHHLHVPAQVIRGVGLGLPTLVLIRNPEDAVVSLLMRDPRLSPGLALKSYCDFYRLVEPHRAGFLVADFEDVVRDFPSVIARLNRRFGKSFASFDPCPEEMEAVRREIDAMEANALKSPNPKPQRDRLKPELLVAIRTQQPERLALAEAFHRRFRGFA